MPCLFDAEGNVSARGHPREQRIVLEYDTALLSGSVQRCSVDLDCAVRRLIQSLQNAQKRGFSAAAHADDADEFAFAYAEGDIVQRVEPLTALGIIDCKMFDLNLIRRH